MKTIVCLLTALAAAGCQGSKEEPHASPILTPPPGAVIVPLAVDTRAPNSPRVLPADSPYDALDVEEAAAVLPSFGARALEPPASPGGAAFLVTASYCYDGAAADALARLESGLAARGFVDLERTDAGGRIGVSAHHDAYELLAQLQPGVNPRCDSNRNQTQIAATLRKHRSN